MATLGLLHTAQAHVATLDALAHDHGVATTHVVAPGLLTHARTRGPDAALTEAVQEALATLADRGATALLCTCSTLGAVAEELDIGAPVVRIDRPMAREAVRRGPRIGVVVTLESTLAPTLALLEEEARDARGEVATEVRLVPDAWSAFVAGDIDGSHARVADAARSLAPSTDVIVLAQASMAGAAELLVDLPVLSSPRLAVEAAVRLLTAGPG